jgi:hypothetical protein
MGAKEGNQNASKQGETRVSVPLSISGERRKWAVEQLQKGKIKKPTQQQIVRFIKDWCYAKIDEAMKEE